MDSTAYRLYQVALEKGVISSLPEEFDRKDRKAAVQTALAMALNSSPQKINNWEARGVSADGMIEAERLWGCRAAWLKYGEGSMFPSAEKWPHQYLPEDRFMKLSKRERGNIELYAIEKMEEIEDESEKQQTGVNTRSG